MIQKLILTDNKVQVGVVRNTYERAVFYYSNSLNYIGFEKWLEEGHLKCQVKMYKKCDYTIDFKNWEQELKELQITPINLEIMDGQVELYDWKNWYTLKSIQTMNKLFSEEITKYGFYN